MNTHTHTKAYTHTHKHIHEHTHTHTHKSVHTHTLFNLVFIWGSRFSILFDVLQKRIRLDLILRLTEAKKHTRRILMEIQDGYGKSMHEDMIHGIIWKKIW